MVDLKQVTREFYEYLCMAVNNSRSKVSCEPIEFRCDDEFLPSSTAIYNQHSQS